MLEIIKRIEAIEKRLQQLEQRNTSSQGISAIILDKEHDRILAELSLINATYGDHQTWSKRDIDRKKALIARRNELRARLGIMV